MEFLDDIDLDGTGDSYGDFAYSEKEKKILISDEVPVRNIGGLQFTEIGQFIANEAFRNESPKPRPPLVQEQNAPKIILPTEFDSLVGTPLIDRLVYRRERPQLPRCLVQRDKIISQTLRLNRHARYLRRALKHCMLNRVEYESISQIPINNQRTTLTPAKNIAKAKFVYGHPMLLPTIPYEVVKKMIRKGICSLLTELGFSKCQKSAMDMLFHLTKDSFKRMSRGVALLYNSQHHQRSRLMPFPVDHMLKNGGIKGVNGARFFYNKLVVKRRNRAYNKCRNLHELYRKILAMFKIRNIPLKPEKATTTVAADPISGKVLLYQGKSLIRKKCKRNLFKKLIKNKSSSFIIYRVRWKLDLKLMF